MLFAMANANMMTNSDDAKRKLNFGYVIVSMVANGAG